MRNETEAEKRRQCWSEQTMEQTARPHQAAAFIYASLSQAPSRIPHTCGPT